MFGLFHQSLYGCGCLVERDLYLQYDGLGEGGVLDKDGGLTVGSWMGAYIPTSE